MDQLREQLEALASKLDRPKKVPGKNIAMILRALLAAHPPAPTTGEAGTRGEGPNPRLTQGE